MPPKRTQAGSVFLKHRLPLDADRIVKLMLPVDLTAREAMHIQQFIDALVLPTRPRKSAADDWPFDAQEEDDCAECDDDECDDWDCVLTDADLESPAKNTQPEGAVTAPALTQPE